VEIIPASDGGKMDGGVFSTVVVFAVDGFGVRKTPKRRFSLAARRAVGRTKRIFILETRSDN
jgi:hypothetical protein